MLSGIQKQQEENEKALKKSIIPIDFDYITSKRTIKLNKKVL